MTNGWSASYLEVVKSVRQSGQLDGPEWNVVILRDIVLEPVLTTYLTYFAMQRGVRLNVHYSPYNNILQYVEEPANQSLLKQADCLIGFPRLETVSRRLSSGLPDLTEKQIAEEKAYVRQYTESVLAAVRKRTDAMILWSGFVPLTHSYSGILDSYVGVAPAELIADMNRETAAMLKELPYAYYFDLPQLVMRTGASQFYDPRGWHIHQAPYSKVGCREIASSIVRFIAAGKGMSKKCLVLDCDQTLWGGIVAEDGLAGIRIGTGRGESAYLEFQQEILNLHRRGVILALCSKNNEEDVWGVFDRHPGMLLKRHHFASYQINWEPKIVNLERIAKELCIDLSSMVMADDSPFEIEQIRTMLPQVATIALNAEQPYRYAIQLSSSGLFDTLALSQEDRRRGEMYRASLEREKMRPLFRSVQEYLSSLGMRAVVQRVADQELARVAQLSQRTNQFNLHTTRYSVYDIETLGRRPDTDILVLSLQDRFGEYGLVGVCILSQAAESAWIDTFLLSCRAIGRGAEDVLLDAAVQAAAARGCTKLIGIYKETGKNAAFASFYDKKGFHPLQAADGRSYWELELTQYVFQTPPYIAAEVRIDTDNTARQGRKGGLHENVNH
ncbi:HAD-IIIC family phosphatase [Paenibacillus xylaniclasticus]|uniref:HAD-IIIC family phosphatase n=1 Tax=Paenibacillus xylaniclasticus TaxID=588083 RepID=UPI000FD92E20|nr:MULTISPECIES: HAD-IIIC family phosphatase [Paenibacillus]GFN32195.1 hypothetical protein PCURB6_24550 [Paenibacillus curdlanolyticus]